MLPQACQTDALPVNEGRLHKDEEHAPQSSPQSSEVNQLEASEHGLLFDDSEDEMEAKQRDLQFDDCNKAIREK